MIVSNLGAHSVGGFIEIFLLGPAFADFVLESDPNFRKLKWGQEHSLVEQKRKQHWLVTPIAMELKGIVQLLKDWIIFMWQQVTHLI